MTVSNISFGCPRSDICDKCEKFVTDMKGVDLAKESTQAAELKVQHELHVWKADVFNMQINEAAEAGRVSGNTAVIAMDFEKNLLLPLTGIGQEYYKWQLWVHNLCIHDCISGGAHMYLHAEHYAGKGPNDVISCLQHYMTTLPQTTKKMVIFADNCFSQNKNR